jgi:hypothetical protein
MRCANNVSWLHQSSDGRGHYDGGYASIPSCRHASLTSGPHLEPIRTRLDEFDFTIATTAAYLRGLWPELEGVVFEVAQGPAEAIHGDHVDRWKVWHDERRITFYRLPIVRFLRLQEGEDREEKLLIESCVFRAVAELLDKDPWELAPGRYRHL